MQSEIKGTGVALITPFTSNGDVDFVALENLVNHVTDGGVDYLVVLGTTGESVTLSKEEKFAVVEKVKEVNNGRLPIVLGYAGNNTKALVDGINDFNYDGISAILSATPAYNKPSQEGLFQHYSALLDVSPVPFILYTVPGRTCVNMDPETVIRLAHEYGDKVIGVKEASGDLNQMEAIIKTAPERFQVISGDDGLAFALVQRGGKGLISVIANAFPKEICNVVNLSLEGKFEEAKEAQENLDELIGLAFADGNPSGIKAMLSELGMCENVLRLPLVPVNPTVGGVIKKEIAAL